MAKRSEEGQGVTINTEEQLRAYIKDRIISKPENHFLGTEWEMFPLDANGNPASYEAITAFMLSIKSQAGDKARLVMESETITGVEIDGLGSLSLEPGGQIEFATCICTSPEDVENKLRAYKALYKVAEAESGITLKGGGYNKAFRGRELAPRSRFEAYKNYIDTISPEGIPVSQATCSYQINADVNGDRLNEMMRALMVAECLLSYRYNKSERMGEWVEHWNKGLLAKQSTPFYEVFDTTSLDDTLNMITNRMMDINVGLWPDPSDPNGYLSYKDVGYSTPPTVRQIMNEGKLNEDMVKNVMALMIMFPATRRPGVIEMRSIDGPETIEDAIDITRIAGRIAHDPEIRHMFANAFSSGEEAKAFMQQVFRKNRDDSVIAKMIEANPKLEACYTFICGDDSTAQKLALTERRSTNSTGILQPQAYS